MPAQPKGLLIAEFLLKQILIEVFVSFIQVALMLVVFAQKQQM